MSESLPQNPEPLTATQLAVLHETTALILRSSLAQNYVSALENQAVCHEAYADQHPDPELREMADLMRQATMAELPFAFSFGPSCHTSQESPFVDLIKVDLRTNLPLIYSAVFIGLEGGWRTYSEYFTLDDVKFGAERLRVQKQHGLVYGQPRF